MLKKFGYGLIIGCCILYMLKDWIDLMTYGRIHLLLYFVFFGSIIYLLVATIIELVRTHKQKKNNKRSNLIFILSFVVFSFFFIFRPYNPHVFVKYKEVWVWKGWYQTKNKSEEAAVWKIFNSYGRLKLATNGRFILTWRSMFNSWNYYGDWSYSGNTLRLSYVGRKNKRIGTELTYISGYLYALNIPDDFAPQVVLSSEY